MDFIPHKNRVVLEPLLEEKISKGGIVLPDTAEKEKPQKGKIVAIGDSISPNLKVGSVVLFKKYGPDEFEIDKIKYLVCDDDDILIVLK